MKPFLCDNDKKKHSCEISEDDEENFRKKTHRQIRINELIRKHSSKVRGIDWENQLICTVKCNTRFKKFYPIRFDWIKHVANGEITEKAYFCPIFYPYENEPFRLSEHYKTPYELPCKTGFELKPYISTLDGVKFPNGTVTSSSIEETCLTPRHSSSDDSTNSSITVVSSSELDTLNSEQGSCSKLMHWTD